MKRKASALTLILALSSAIILVQSVNLAVANPQIGYDPIITINGDGVIDTADTPIVRKGNMYTLGGNITGYSLNVECNNITVDGAGYAINAYSAFQRITVEADGVTVKNFADAEVGVTGSFNTIAENSLASVSLAGDNNNVTGNRIGGLIDMQGVYNSIERNIVQGIDVSVSYSIISGNFVSRALFFRGASSFNTIVGNEIRDCHVILDKEHNIFYLNNFINNTFNVNFDPEEDSLTVYSVNVFDNGSVGNYWSDYSSSDNNHDGIGDLPYGVLVTDVNYNGIGDTLYVLDGVTDRYPLMAPYDIENNTIVVPIQTEPFPTAPVAAATAMVAAAIVLVIYRKRKR